MCGIYLALSRNKYVPPSEELQQGLHKRGPDSSRHLKFEIRTRQDHTVPDPAIDDARIFISVYSTVLSLRGSKVVSQPLTTLGEHQGEQSASFLCWNGEAWTFTGSSIKGNDSEHVLSLLQHVSASVTLSSASDHGKAMAEALASFAGPCAFAFFDAARQRLFFGRDLLGRRSLLYRVTDMGDFVLSSISDRQEAGWKEVEADGVYWVDLESKVGKESLEIKKTSYFFDGDQADACGTSSPRPLLLNKAVPSEVTDTKKLCPSAEAVHIFYRLLKRSVSLRVRDVPTLNKVELNIPNFIPARVAILFSGGLDCTVLARLAHDILKTGEPVDLLNVAFENPRVNRANNADVTGKGPSLYEQCPDRMTGRKSFAELQRVCPSREWRFVAIDIPYQETLAHRKTVISLMYPQQTEMDLSISCALYFASRGVGFVIDQSGARLPYSTNARVLLSGLGADEIYGGYQRHATAFQRQGFGGLIDELELDVSRLGKRNLGRDDRIISSWAREARFPFLDESLVNWALSQPVWEKCGFGVDLTADNVGAEHGVITDPTKMLLRCLAADLGMLQVANEKKRAIQFGTRTAKMEVGRTKGTDSLPLAG